MAILFDDGSAQWVNLGTDLPLLRNVSGMTLMAWVNPVVVVAQHIVLAVAIGPPPGTSGSSRASIEFNGTPIVIFIRNADGDVVFSASAGTMVANQWQHVGFTHNCDSKAGVIYRNGVSVGTFTSTGLTGTATSDTNSKNAAIGAQDDGAGSAFDGAIEDARVYGRVLSEAEFLTIFTSKGKDGIVAGLQGRWPMQELGEGITATRIADLSNNGISGTPTAGPVYQAGITSPRGRRSWSGG
jgi:hypothetical protein